MDNLRQQIQDDADLKSKGKILIILATILATTNLTGASIEEANTFIFKIKFENSQNISHLLTIATAFLCIRYYTYAQEYHDKLFKLWTTRMLNDHRVMHEEYPIGEVGGLLGKKINVYTPEEPEVFSCDYLASFPFTRKITYEHSLTDHDDNGVRHSLTSTIDLNKFDKNWRPLNLLQLLGFELKYQIESIFKHREGLDLLTPYVIALIAVATSLAI